MSDIPFDEERVRALAQQIAIEDGVPDSVPMEYDYTEARALLQRHFDKNDLTYLIPGDPAWPTRLNDLPASDPVLGLWVKGKGYIDEMTRKTVAIVGSRSSTTYGNHAASEMAAHAARTHVVISNASYGIDAAAMSGVYANANQGVIAVLACGADRAYPSGNAALLTKVTSTGCVVSEVPPGKVPSRTRFMRRNRITAALSGYVLVVEAAERSGALNVAEWADEVGRPVGAVPGPITSAASHGTHRLIREGADLIDSKFTLLDALGVI